MVRQNVSRIRKAFGLTSERLVQTMSERGYNMPRTAISEIENGGRRVSVDDLMALAVALGVPPNSLLLPHADPAPAPAATAAGEAGFQDLWAWADGNGPLRSDETAAEGMRLRDLARPVLLNGTGSPDEAAITARMLALMQEVTALSYELKTRGP